MSKDPQQGEIVDSFEGLTNKPHDSYKNVVWVPAWSVQAEYQLILAVVSILGGALLGAGLSASPPSPPAAAIKAVAQACIDPKDSTGACASLTFNGAGGSAWQLICGIVLVAVYIGVLIVTELRKSKTPQT